MNSFWSASILHRVSYSIRYLKEKTPGGYQRPRARRFRTALAGLRRRAVRLRRHVGCTAAPARARAWHAAAALLRPPAARARAASAQAQRGRRRTPPGSGRQGPGSRGSARFCARCVQEQAPPLQTDCWNQLRQRPAAKHGAESDLSAYVMPQKYLTENLPFQLHLFLRY